MSNERKRQITFTHKSERTPHAQCRRSQIHTLHSPRENKTLVFIFAIKRENLWNPKTWFLHHSVWVCARVHFKNKLCGNAIARAVLIHNNALTQRERGRERGCASQPVRLNLLLTKQHWACIQIVALSFWTRLCAVSCRVASFSHFSSSTFCCRYAFPLLHLCHVHCTFYIVHLNYNSVQFRSVPLIGKYAARQFHIKRCICMQSE